MWNKEIREGREVQRLEIETVVEVVALQRLTREGRKRDGVSNTSETNN